MNLERQRTYFCIDMKSFFASVECAERGLSPFEANLVVVDDSRGQGAICLAVSPKMKNLGVKNRCRLFEIPKDIEYISAKPRMKKYIEYASEIYAVYLKYISPDDIYVYSIDESFIDVTDYLTLYKKTAKEFAKKLVEEIAQKTHIPSTVGIGTNLYLAKVALDITAKKSIDHIGELTEESYKKTLWNHLPLTDFWSVGKGTEARLNKIGVYDMEGITKVEPYILYKIFGINAELLIDHAYGREPCLIKDIKNYKKRSKSISNSQILFHDYDYNSAKIALIEMALKCTHDLIDGHYIANGVSVAVNYSKNVIPPTGKSCKLTSATNRYSVISKVVEKLYEESTNKYYPIRKLSLSFNDLADESAEGYDFFTDVKQAEREKTREKTVVEIKYKFGKNSILRGIDLMEGATAKERNKLIGGHNSE